MKALNMIVAVLLNDRWRGPAIRHRWHQSIRRFWRRREKDWQKENVKTASQGREKTAETGVWLISKSIQKFIVIAIKKNLLFFMQLFHKNMYIYKCFILSRLLKVFKDFYKQWVFSSPNIRLKKKSGKRGKSVRLS